MESLILLIREIALHLNRKQWQLVTAESCTGGLIASVITEIPGSSVWFERGFVTYSNLSKQEMLSVPEDLLIKFGAVSEEVACAMSLGALRHSAGHIALAVTGIAGPDGGTIDKPVGTVCFGWAYSTSSTQTSTIHYSGTRQEIRFAACHHALDGVLSILRAL